jgi:hypothetical protein
MEAFTSAIAPRGNDNHGLFLQPHDKFRLLAVPLDLAAQPVSVLVQDPVGLNRALVPMLDPPHNSPDFFVYRARTRVGDRNHFGLHRVCEIRRRTTGRVRRIQGDLPAFFHV